MIGSRFAATSVPPGAKPVVGHGGSRVPWAAAAGWWHRLSAAVAGQRLVLAGLAVVLAAAGAAVAVLRWRRGRASASARVRWLLLPTDSFGGRGLGEELLRFAHGMANTRAPSAVLTPSSWRAVRIRLTSASGSLAWVVDSPEWMGSAIASALPSEVELAPADMLTGGPTPSTSAAVGAPATESVDEVPATRWRRRPAPCGGVGSDAAEREAEAQADMDGDRDGSDLLESEELVL